MAGGPTHLGYGRPPEELESALRRLEEQVYIVQQQMGDIVNLLNLNTPPGEVPATDPNEVQGDITTTNIYNPMTIVESIGENREVLLRLIEYLNLTGGDGGPTIIGGPNVWEPYTGS